MNRKKLLFPALLVLVLATAVTITTATFTTSLSTVNNSGVDVVDFTSHHSLSGEALLDGGFTNADTLNIALVDGTDSVTSVPSQPPSLQDSMDGAVADDGGVQTTETTEANNATINDMTLLPTTPVVDDAYYFGSDHPFTILTLNTGTAGVGSWTITWEYYTGVWIPLSNVDDRTVGFKKAGTKTVSYDMPDDWVVQTVNGIVNKYWIRARVSDFVSVTAAPVGTQSLWETGSYIVFNDSLLAGQQEINTLALGSTVDLVDGHQFFPGDAGYLVLDDPSLEHASDYLIRVAAYIETDATAPGTSSILEKTAAVRIYNPADGTIRLRLNGVTDLDITGVEDGYYVMDVYDDSVNVVFTIYGVGSATNATVAIADNANDWEFGTEGAVIYFDHIVIGLPLVFYESTITQFTAWAHTDTEAVALPDDGALTLDGWDEFGSLCQSNRNPPDGWVFGFCGGGTQNVGWVICADVYGVGTCLDGNLAMQLETNRNFNAISSIKPIDDTPAVEGEVYSIGAYCNLDDVFTNSPIAGVAIEFLDISLVQLSITYEKGDYTGPCGLNQWLEAKIENLAAPANTAWVRFHMIVESWSTGSKGKEIHFDEVRANEGATVVPNFEHVDNLLPNGSFEQLYPSVGTGESIQLDPTSITSVTTTSIDWSEDIPADTGLTIEASIDNGTIWVEIENTGDPIPGISSGDDLSGGSNFKVRGVFTSANGQATAVLEDITMVISGTGATLDGWWQPNELIGDTLTDRSANTNNAVTSFPLPTDSHDFQFVTGAFVSTGFSDISDVTGSGIDVVPEINEVDIISADTDFSYLPFHDLVLLLAGDFIPIEIAWALLTGVVIVVIGMFAMVFLGSVALSGGIMAILTLFATNVGTDGIIPFWVFAFAALGVVGILIWTHPKVSL